jgi:capsule polysaccharide export protein KpsE/RkpR
MTNKPLAVASLALCILAAGCEPSAKPSATEPRDATTQQLDKVKQEAKEASQELKDYAYAQKAEFVAQMQVRLTEIQRDLDQLETKLETAGDAAKAETKPKLQALRDQVARLTKQLDEARNATDSTWSEVKAGFNQGYQELKDGFQAARQWVSDKIAP